MPRPKPFRFRKHERIGDPSAESDDAFLIPCFVDTGILDTLQDSEDHRGILLGRTGAGKTALLRMLHEREDRVIQLNPHDIALSYISNASVIRFFEAADVRMDPFYRFLWRHVFIVELLRCHFRIDAENPGLAWHDNLVMTMLRKTAHKTAYEYLKTWGTSFVATSEERNRQITDKVESSLKATTGVDILDFLKLGAEGSKLLSREQKIEYQQRGNEVIDSLQLSKLSGIFNALDEDILRDKGKHYYIVVDQLDEEWVDDITRYRLIRALIETMRDFNTRISNVKVVIALRSDLYDRILHGTSESGFQTEKFDGLCLPVTWNQLELADVLDRRVNELVQRRYTGQSVKFKDLVSESMGKGTERSLDFLLSRTLLRPRDAIAFFNECIAHADGKPTIRAQTLREAEGPYSVKRLKSLCDEWASHYSHLLAICMLLKQRAWTLAIGELDTEALEDLCLTILGDNSSADTEDVALARSYLDGQCSTSELRTHIIRILYRVGAIGIKSETYSAIRWSFSGAPELDSNDVSNSGQIYVHRMLWRVLGIVPEGRVG